MLYLVSCAAVPNEPFRGVPVTLSRPAVMLITLSVVRLTCPARKKPLLTSTAPNGAFKFSVTPGLVGALRIKKLPSILTFPFWAVSVIVGLVFTPKRNEELKASVSIALVSTLISLPAIKLRN